MELVNLARLDDGALATLAAEACRPRSLGEVLAWLGSLHPQERLVPDVVQLDEYTHDVLFELPDGLVLVYGAT